MATLLDEYAGHRSADAVISKIIPEQRARQLIIVGNRAAYRWVLRIRPDFCSDLLQDDIGPIDLPLPYDEGASPFL